jgi:hypothetical protein
MNTGLVTSFILLWGFFYLSGMGFSILLLPINWWRSYWSVVLFRKIPFLGVIQQSEHINYFGQDSLEILLKQSGFEILAVQGPDFGFKQGKIKLGRIGVLAQRPV